ncbi:hypothetical protein EDB89DRAFT_636696 [Lactarius sanguifluus]|nr:hypothetical protein EDB89DRAFT_636696 [Lactarius sanguifluus]
MSSRHIETSHLMPVSSCSRYSRPTRKNDPHCTTSSTMRSLPTASFLGTYPSPHGTCPPTSDTYLPSSHKRISLACGRRVNSTGRPSQPRDVTSNLPPQAQVARAVLRSRSVNSKRRCNLAARSPRCSALHVSHSWLRPAVLVPCAGNRHSFASCKPQRRKQSSHPPGTQKATRLQGITEEGGAAYEMQGEEARTKELQSQKARIVAQMVPCAGSTFRH